MLAKRKQLLVLLAPLAFLAAVVALLTPPDPAVDLRQFSSAGLNDSELLVYIEGIRCMTERSDAVRRRMFGALTDQPTDSPAPWVTAVTRTGDPDYPYTVHFGGEHVRARRLDSPPWWQRLRGWLLGS